MNPTLAVRYLALLLLSALLLHLTPTTARAQADEREDNEYERLHRDFGLDYRTFRVSLIPGLSSNGVDAPRYAGKYSFNLLAGYNGALDRGFELGGLLNLNKYYMHGGQIAGLGNYSGEESAGVQLAGVFNWSEEEMRGIQLAGAANVSRSDLQGIQLSSAVNIAGGASQGIQISGALNYAELDMQGIFLSGAVNYAGNMQGIVASGLFNYAGSDFQGIAAAGLFNYAGTFQGLAFAPINIADFGQGIQGGTVNVAQYMQGLQIGLINYAREMEGVPVGLISYYENGRRNLDVWSSDAGFVNLGVKLGTREVYNMISIGYNPALGRDRNVWQVGWSIGRLHRYRTHFLFTDFSVFKINEDRWTRDLNSLFKYRLLFGKELAGGLGLYGGPAFNLLISRTEESSDYTWYRIFDFGAKGRSYVFWIGYSVGVQLF